MTHLPRPAAAALLLAAAAALAGCARKTPEPAASKPQTVTIANPIRWTVEDYEDFTGRTEPYRVVELRSRVSGYLEAIHFRDGDDVMARQPLFDIDRKTYKAEYDKATAALAKAEKHYKTMGQNLERAKNGIGVTSKADFDQAQGAFDEAEADIASATAALELAEANLNYTHIAAPFAGRLSKRMVDPGNLVKADETPLTTLVALDPIYATFDVDERTVTRIRELIREGKVKSSREKARDVKIGLASDDDRFPLGGQIVFADNQIDASTGTLRVRAKLSNPPLDRQPRYMLSPGQFVRVRMPVGIPREAVLVPEKAIGTDQGQKYVFVVNDKKVVQRRNIHVGQQHVFRVWARDDSFFAFLFAPVWSETFRVVEDGVLKPEERVVVDGLLRVRDGGTVDEKRGFVVIPEPVAPATRPETAPEPRSAGNAAE